METEKKRGAWLINHESWCGYCGTNTPSDDSSGRWCDVCHYRRDHHEN